MLEVLFDWNNKKKFVWLFVVLNDAVVNVSANYSSRKEVNTESKSQILIVDKKLKGVNFINILKALFCQYPFAKKFEAKMN